jgi:hypothetical protein
MRGCLRIVVAEPSLHKIAAGVFPTMVWKSVLNWGDTACFRFAQVFHCYMELLPNKIQDQKIVFEVQ